MIRMSGNQTLNKATKKKINQSTLPADEQCVYSRKITQDPGSFVVDISK